MDKESLLRLGLDATHIDIGKSDELYNPSTNKHIIKIHLIKGDTLYCPHCGACNSCRPRSSITQYINHSSLLENNISLALTRRVYICECGKTFREPNPFSFGKRKNTREKDYMILEALKNINTSFKDVANQFQLSVTTVQNIFDKYVSVNRLSLTEVLCVDEVYSKHCGYHKYCFITYSPQLDQILDVIPSRNKEFLCRYFGNIPIKERTRVKYFSMDLYGVYRQVAKLCFPKALICADHFHVIKNLTECFNSARTRIMKKYEHLKNQNDSWYWLYKKYWRKLLKDPSKLGYKRFKTNRTGMYLDEHQVVEYMLSIDSDLKDAYNLLNEYRSFNSTATIETAEAELDELIIKFHNSKIEEYRHAYRLLKNWKNEIVNSFTKINNRRISNGPMERVNRDIKTLTELKISIV